MRDDFQVTGLAHLVAASGANVLLLARVVLAIAAVVGLGLSARLWLAIVIIAAYVPLAGAGPSIQRAGVMGVAGLIAALAGRPSSRWYALLLAAALTLAFNPRAAEDPGWQLSFAAVLAMLALVAPLTRAPAIELAFRARWPRRSRSPSRRRSAPRRWIALHFERLSLVSLPVNVLAAPAVAPIMWLGTIAGALAQIAPLLAKPFATAVGAAARHPHVAGGARRGSAVRGGLRLAPQARSAWPRCTGPRSRQAFAWRYDLATLDPHAGGHRSSGHGAAPSWRCGEAAAATVALLLVTRPPAPPRDLTVSFLDIGQGDATLIQHGTAWRSSSTPVRPTDRFSSACVTRACGGSTCSSRPTPRSTTTVPLQRCSRSSPVGMVLDGEEATAATPVAGESRRCHWGACPRRARSLRRPRDRLDRDPRGAPPRPAHPVGRGAGAPRSARSSAGAVAAARSARAARSRAQRPRDRHPPARRRLRHAVDRRRRVERHGRASRCPWSTR